MNKTILSKIICGSYFCNQALNIFRQIIDFISFIFYLISYKGFPFWYLRVILQYRNFIIRCEQLFNTFIYLTFIFLFVEKIICIIAFTYFYSRQYSQSLYLTHILNFMNSFSEKNQYNSIISLPYVLRYQ